jgi:hypothetical protein
VNIILTPSYTDCWEYRFCSGIVKGLSTLSETDVICRGAFMIFPKPRPLTSNNNNKWKSYQLKKRIDVYDTAENAKCLGI